MFSWDFHRHLDAQHSKCKVCQQYLVNEEMLLDHMYLEHPTVKPEPVVTEDQVTEDPATLEADCQVKCKYCDRHFKNVAECNMHVNRRHKRVKCPQCEKHFVKQADCDNHVRDVQKFGCSISGCSVVKYNQIELHEHLRYHHRSKMVFSVINVLRFSALGQNYISTMKWTTAWPNSRRCKEGSFLALGVLENF